MRCIWYAKVVYEAGLADIQVPLSDIFHEIMLCIGINNRNCNTTEL